MDEKDLVEGMREYISLLQKEGRYSSAKSYQDAMNSFIRYSGTDRIPYTYINKDTLRRYEAYLLEKGCLLLSEISDKNSYPNQNIIPT